MTGRLRPPEGCEDWPDDRFPSTLTISGNLIAYPQRGNLIAVVCCACGRAAEFSGRVLIRSTAWLARPAVEWCAALRCSVCGSARILAASYQDPAANAFIGREEAPVVWCRRVADWLEGTGLTLGDVLDILPPPVPPRAELAACGLLPG